MDIKGKSKALDLDSDSENGSPLGRYFSKQLEEDQANNKLPSSSTSTTTSSDSIASTSSQDLPKELTNNPFNDNQISRSLSTDSNKTVKG